MLMTPWMRMLNGVALLACLLIARPADAVVLASDDFEADGGGTGFDPNDTWDNLSGGVSDTAIGPAFRNFESPLQSFDYPSIFISFDLQVNQPISWGGVALFDAVEESLFIGRAGDGYALDTKGSGILDSGVPFDNSLHHFIAQVEFGAENDTYRLWVDNFNQSVPNSEYTIDGVNINEPWQYVRIASDTGAGTAVKVDNLTIATSASDVQLSSRFDAYMLVDRATGDVTLKSSTGSLANVVGYALTSTAGGLDPMGWVPIDGNSDTPDGDGTLDDDDWLVVGRSTNALAEMVVSPTPGDGLTLDTTGVILSSAWNPSPFEDVEGVVFVNDGGTFRQYLVDVSYDPASPSIAAGDLDGDGDIDMDDWNQFLSGQGAVNFGMSRVEAYQKGDLDGNFKHNLADFNLFVAAYEAANGVGSFNAAVSSVPEPTSLATFSLGIAALICSFRLKNRATC